jgi:hypothetical protein
MAANKITINITPCDNLVTGYYIFYRPVGSNIPYRQSDLLPVGATLTWTDENDATNTEYEGYIQSICPAGKSQPVTFNTIEQEYTWSGTSPYCLTGPTCPAGYAISEDNTTCTKINPGDPGPATVAPSELNTGMQGFNTRTRQPGGFSEDNIEGVGVGPYFPPVENTDSDTGCPIGQATIPEFDFLVAKYSWVTGAGTDLDTMTGFIDTGTVYDNKYVGYGAAQVPGGIIPAGASAENAYIYWGSDNTGGSGPEAILINFKKFVQENTPVADIVKVRMNAVWYNSKLTGDITVQIIAYKGGTMSKLGFDFINTGGVEVYQQSLNSNVQVQNQAANIASSQDVAVVSFSQTNKTASIVLV